MLDRYEAPLLINFLQSPKLNRARRLSADLGLPAAADDRQLSAELPKDSPGFPPPEAMITNIKIARATGNIMTCKAPFRKQNSILHGHS